MDEMRITPFLASMYNNSGKYYCINCSFVNPNSKQFVILVDIWPDWFRTNVYSERGINAAVG